MSKAKVHTSGEWEVDPPDPDDVAGLDWRVLVNGMVICSGIWGMGLEEDEANARLLASAPKLLKLVSDMYHFAGSDGYRLAHDTETLERMEDILGLS